MSIQARCLTCDSTETTHFLHARDHGSGEIVELRRCGRCGLVFTWPCPADLNKYYPTYYRQYPRWILRGFQFVQQMRTGSWVKTIGPAGRAVELGCGEGWILAALRRRGWRVAGIERTPQGAQFAAHQLGLPVIVGSFEALRSTTGFDLIILHQVLEHLPHPMHTPHECTRLLRPGGHVIIEVPNLDSWQFLYARQHWVHLDAPRHVSHFTPESLHRALELAGLQVERYRFVSF